MGHLEFDTPPRVKEAACKALEDGHTHYTHSLGMYELREAICENHRVHLGRIHLDPNQVIVTSGSSPAIFLVFSTLLEKGDEVIISDPHYACYPNFINLFRGYRLPSPFTRKTAFNPAGVDQRENKFQNQSNFYQLTLQSYWKPAIGKPHAGNCRSGRRPESPHIVSDEIYHGLVYEGQSTAYWNIPIALLMLKRIFKTFCHDRPAAEQ